MVRTAYEIDDDIWFIRLMIEYPAEVKWCHDGHVPTFGEYMSVAGKTSTFEQLIVTSFLGMGTITGLETFEGLKANPRILTAVDLIGRMMDDMDEQHNLSEKETLEDFEKKLEDASKDVNEECMRPTVVPRELLLRPLNYARAAYFVLQAWRWIHTSRIHHGRHPCHVH